ncbi:MAG TPA: hypothetical protein VFJ79_07330, partial [Acidimicrobiales bacterium]|nr:hypothetical protein [Acidimicrobiales bacterium]
MKELVYHRFLLPTVERLPDEPGVLDADFTATYSQHLTRVNRLTDGMRRELGVSDGSRFAV